MMNRVSAIVPAAGLGTRMGADMPKQFLELDGVPLVVFTLRRLAACPAITDFLIATRGDEVDSLAARFAQENLGRPVRVVRGGDTRQDSVSNALAEVPRDADLILHKAGDFLEPEVEKGIARLPSQEVRQVGLIRSNVGKVVCSTKVGTIVEEIAAQTRDVYSEFELISPFRP